MSLHKRIIMNACSNWATMLVTAVVGLILVPIMLSGLGKAGFGVWALFAYGLSYPIILEMAFALAINRFVAFHRNDISELNRYLSTRLMVILDCRQIVPVSMRV